MITAAFRHSHRARITHGKTLTRDTFKIGLASNRPIQNGVANNDIGRRITRKAGRRLHRNAPARKPLTHVVIRITGQFQRHTTRQESAEATTCRALEGNADGIFRQPRMAITLRHLT